MTEYKIISEIIGDIYEASYRLGMWEVVIEKIVRFSNSKSGGIFMQDMLVKEANGFYVYGMNEEVLDEYAKHSKEDPAFQIMQKKAVGTAVNIHGPEQHEFESNDYYSLIREKYDIGYVGGANILVSDKKHVGLGLHRSAKDTPFEEKTLSLITELILHLQRAVNIQSELIQLRLEKEAASSYLGSMIIGVIIFDDEETPVHINSVARAMLIEDPDISQQGNVFFLNDKKDEVELKRLIKVGIDNSKEKNFNEIGMMSLSRPDKKSPLVVMIKPLNSEENASHLSLAPGYVGVYITDPEKSLQLDSDILEVLYGLSPAETKISIALTNGMSLNEMADLTHRSVETIRSHLKSLFRKTGTRSQA